MACQEAEYARTLPQATRIRERWTAIRSANTQSLYKLELGYLLASLYECRLANFVANRTEATKRRGKGKGGEDPKIKRHSLENKYLLLTLNYSYIFQKTVFVHII